MELGKLDDLTETLRKKLAENLPAKLVHTGLSLVINSNPRSHTLGELVQVVERGTAYNIHYMALFVPACETFLAPQHQEEIAVTLPLNRWAREIADRKREGDSERYEQNKFYGELISLEEKGISFPQVNDACDFLVRRFNEKYRAHH